MYRTHLVANLMFSRVSIMRGFVPRISPGPLQTQPFRHFSLRTSPPSPFPLQRSFLTHARGPSAQYFSSSLSSSSSPTIAASLSSRSLRSAVSVTSSSSFSSSSSSSSDDRDESAEKLVKDSKRILGRMEEQFGEDGQGGSSKGSWKDSFPKREQALVLVLCCCWIVSAYRMRGAKARAREREAELHDVLARIEEIASVEGEDAHARTEAILEIVRSVERAE
eukprot:TRINITY_DN510_c3_g1_i1.p1 TRINITY_DN510_c3_g1~~TRINITY_DN510_c3_g1_i1.p1  ORF type:complete len:222 (-),score=40.26 TRINITY_DN510_c3_g1_i1:36-701(-)